MPASLLYKWMDFERLEPFGQPWQNWLMAVPAVDFASVHAKKGTQISLKDYIYEDKQSKIERQNAELFTFFDAKVDKHGG